MRLVAGLTGGIGSGKSTVARLFQERGACLVDTDAIAHTLTGAAGAAMDAIRREFGTDLVTQDGALDRAAMRRKVFSDPEAKATLEAILHPLIRAEAVRQTEACPGPYVVLVVPLLVETGGYRSLVGRVLVVDCGEEEQITRTMERSRLSREQVRAIMETQASRAERLRQADDVIDNSGAPEALASAVDVLHRKYLDLAGA